MTAEEEEEEEETSLGSKCSRSLGRSSVGRWMCFGEVGKKRAGREQSVLPLLAKGKK